MPLLLAAGATTSVFGRWCRCLRSWPLVPLSMFLAAGAIARVLGPGAIDATVGRALSFARASCGTCVWRPLGRCLAPSGARCVCWWLHRRQLLLERRIDGVSISTAWGLPGGYSRADLGVAAVDPR